MASLYFKYAAMNSGKSTQLLQAHYNYTERGMNPLALTAQIDNRYGAGKITARIGLDLPAMMFNTDTDVFALVSDIHKKNKIDVVVIDESQFMTKTHVLECARVVDELDIPVMCYGLKTDFMGNLFAGSEALLCYADKIEEIKTICWCGKKATMTARFSENGQIVRDGAQIAIGGNDMYTSLCRKHFIDGQLGAEEQTVSKKQKTAA